MVRKIRRPPPKEDERKADVPSKKVRSFEEPTLPARIEVAVDQASQVQALAFALEDPRARARLIALGVSEDLFTVSEYDALWKVVEIAHDKDLLLDQTTVAAYAEDPGLIQIAAGIRTHKPPDANLLDVVERLRWGAAVVAAAEEVPAFAALLHKRSRPAEVMSAARAIVDTLERGRPFGRRFSRDEKLVSERVELVKLRKIRGRYPFGLPGFDVDDAFPEGDPKRYRTTVGMAPGKTTVLTALSGNGKSTVLANIYLAQISLGRKVLAGAWEDEPGDVLELMAAVDQGIDLTRLTVGELTDEEERIHADAMARLSERISFMPNPLERVRKARFRNDEVLSLVQAHIEESGCDVAAFDLWARAFSFKNEQEESEALSRQQAIAKSTGCHVLLVNQQKLKEVEKREDKRPTREGNKGSGEWTGVADTMIGVYRPDLYKNVPPGTIEVTILKQRRGRWPLAVEFDFDPQFGRLERGRGVSYDSPGTAPADSNNELTRAIDGKRKGKKRG